MLNYRFVSVLLILTQVTLCLGDDQAVVEKGRQILDTYGQAIVQISATTRVDVGGGSQEKASSKRRQIWPICSSQEPPQLNAVRSRS